MTRRRGDGRAVFEAGQQLTDVRGGFAETNGAAGEDQRDEEPAAAAVPARSARRRRRW